jgi:hypothetical protein
MPFAPGHSGNPAGRPPGARNKRTLAVEKLMDESAEKIVRRVFRLADEGDRMMLRVCMDRIAPRAKHGPVAFELPKIASASDALGALGSIVQGVADGELTAIEAAELATLVRLISQVAAETVHEQRIKSLEGVVAQIAKSK